MAVPQRRYTIHRGDVVASSIPELPILDMTQAAVELNPQHVLVMVDVDPNDAPPRDPLLTTTGRQTVGPFNPAQMPKLKRRLGPLVDIGEHALQHGSPPDLRA